MHARTFTYIGNESQRDGLTKVKSIRIMFAIVVLSIQLERVHGVSRALWYSWAKDDISRRSYGL